MIEATGSSTTPLEELQSHLLNVIRSICGILTSFLLNTLPYILLPMQLPALSNLKTEPTVISIDRLDIVLAEKIEEDEDDATPAEAPAPSPAKAATPSSSYGMGDKVWTHLAT
jgi:hypothetical protein